MEEQAPNGATTLTLGGTRYRVRVPASFADREDLAALWARKNDATKSRRVFGATLALCIPEIAAAAGVPIPDDGALMPLGKAAYDALRGLGCDNADIAQAASACFAVAVEGLYPRKGEVEKAEDFSPAGAPAI